MLAIQTDKNTLHWKTISDFDEVWSLTTRVAMRIWDGLKIGNNDFKLRRNVEYEHQSRI